jgi:hypothetical protein
VTGDELPDRDVTDNAFHEWLLSDHPDAVRAWAEKINVQPDGPQTLRDLAASMGPQADQTSARAEARYVGPDDFYVARTRAQHETRLQVCGAPGSWDYRYPADLTGPGAAAHLPPPEPGTRTGGKNMIPARGPRRAAAGRRADRRARQRKQGRTRGQVPASHARPATCVPLPEPVALPETTPGAEGEAA